MGELYCVMNYISMKLTSIKLFKKEKKEENNSAFPEVKQDE